MNVCAKCCANPSSKGWDISFWINWTTLPSKGLRPPVRTSNDNTVLVFQEAIYSPPPLFIMNLEQMCQSNRATRSNRGCFCAGTGGGRKHRCPVSYQPIKQHTGPEGRNLPLTGRHQEKHTFQSTHSTHTFNTTHKPRWIKSARYQVLPRGRELTCGGRGSQTRSWQIAHSTSHTYLHNVVLSLNCTVD